MRAPLGGDELGDLLEGVSDESEARRRLPAARSHRPGDEVTTLQRGSDSRRAGFGAGIEGILTLFHPHHGLGPVVATFEEKE